MLGLGDKSNIDLAVIGESMAGKTSWITSLFDEKINCILRQKCLENEEGQTKIKTYYKLVDSDVKDIFVEYIEIAGLILKEKIKNEEQRKKMQPLEEFGIIEKVNLKLEKIEDTDECTDFVRVDLKNEQIDIGTFFDKIINNLEIANLDIINCVCICGPAHKKIYDIMKNVGIKTVTIRDTRGFMDETDNFNDKRKKLKEKEKVKNECEKNVEYDESYKEDIKSLLAERGVLGADGCVFVSAGGNALSKKKQKEQYGFIFESILDNMPSFLLMRSSVLNDKMNDMDRNKFNLEVYKELMKVDEKHKFVGVLRNDNSCRSYIKLLADYGLFDDKKGLKNKIIAKHYKQLLMPEIDIEEFEKEKDKYLLIVQNSFGIIVEELYKYKEEIYKLFQTEKELPNILRNNFKNVLKRNYHDSVYPRNDNKSDTRVLKKQLVENVANECVKDYYYGGLVGERGGLTTYITGYGRTGKYAIDLLEAAYNQFNNIILKVCECIQDENSKEKIYEYLKIVLTKNAFSYSCTNMMINSYYLKMAWDCLENKSSIRNKLNCDNDNKVALETVYDMLDNIIMYMLREAEKTMKPVDLQ